MDDFNHIMESEQPNMDYQSQMMANVNATVDCVESDQQELVELCTPQVAESSENTVADERQADVDGQSVSASVDEILPIKNDSNEIAQLDDKCAVDLNECEDKANAVTANDEVKNQDEILLETDGGGAGAGVGDKDDVENENKSNDNDNGDDGGADGDANEETEPTEENAPEKKTKQKKEDDIELNQCRICMSSENLLDIFRIGEKTSFRICDLIMKLAPSVKISERDYLPHSICGNCVERIETAYELRVQCEETDKILRSKLKRSKKTRRAPSEFVLLDCAESSSDSDDDQKSDDEFQLSEESEESSESDSESSYDDKKKRIISQRGRRRAPPPPPLKRPIPIVAHQPPAVKKARKVVYINAANSDDDDDDDNVKNVQRKPVKTPITNRLPFRCDVCNRPCGSAEALAQHRRTHADEKCNICSMVFKQRSALMQHMQRHREDPERICKKCHRVFTSKIECQRHVQMSHPEPASCQKCKRNFPNKYQLNIHKCTPATSNTGAINNDRKPIDTTSKRKNDTDTSASGRDLFKSVAPLTTTYWSDSFSD